MASFPTAWFFFCRALCIRAAMARTFHVSRMVAAFEFSFKGNCYHPAAGKLAAASGCLARPPTATRDAPAEGSYRQATGMERRCSSVCLTWQTVRAIPTRAFLEKQTHDGPPCELDGHTLRHGATVDSVRAAAPATVILRDVSPIASASASQRPRSCASASSAARRKDR